MLINLNKNKKRRNIFIAMGIILVVGIFRAWPLIGIFTESNLHASRDVKLIDDFIAPRSGYLISYDGCSHPYWDTGRLCFEILLTPRRMIHGHAFTRIAKNNPTVKKIATVLLDQSSFTQWGGNKACGGFHADRYFKWTASSRTWEVLLCMGCHEALLYSDKGSLRCDLSDEAVKISENLEREE
jgi:hypothetical protein